VCLARSNCVKLHIMAWKNVRNISRYDPLGHCNENINLGGNLRIRAIFSIWTKPRRSSIWHLFIFPTFRVGWRVYCGQWNWAKIVIVCRRVFRVRGDLSPPVKLLMVFQRFYTHRGQEIYCPHHLPGHVFNTTTHTHTHTHTHIYIYLYVYVYKYTRVYRNHGLQAYTTVKG
jgi:hypothetical protein